MWKCAIHMTRDTSLTVIRLTSQSHWITGQLKYMILQFELFQSNKLKPACDLSGSLTLRLFRKSVYSGIDFTLLSVSFWQQIPASSTYDKYRFVRAATQHPYSLWTGVIRDSKVMLFLENCYDYRHIISAAGKSKSFQTLTRVAGLFAWQRMLNHCVYVTWPNQWL